MDRRTLLRSSASAAASARSAPPSGSARTPPPPSPDPARTLLAADSNGVMLPKGFTTLGGLAGRRALATDGESG